MGCKSTEGLSDVGLKYGHGFEPDRKPHETPGVWPRLFADGSHIIGGTQADGACPAPAELEQAQAVAERIHLCLGVLWFEHDTEQTSGSRGVPLPMFMTPQAGEVTAEETATAKSRIYT
jgi:hypothetical protein